MHILPDDVINENREQLFDVDIDGPLSTRIGPYVVLYRSPHGPAPPPMPCACRSSNWWLVLDRTKYPRPTFWNLITDQRKTGAPLTLLEEQDQRVFKHKYGDLFKAPNAKSAAWSIGKIKASAVSTLFVMIFVLL